MRQGGSSGTAEEQEEDERAEPFPGGLFSDPHTWSLCSALLAMVECPLELVFFMGWGQILLQPFIFLLEAEEAKGWQGDLSRADEVCHEGASPAAPPGDVVTPSAAAKGTAQ